MTHDPFRDETLEFAGVVDSIAVLRRGDVHPFHGFQLVPAKKSATVCVRPIIGPHKDHRLHFGH